LPQYQFKPPIDADPIRLSRDSLKLSLATQHEGIGGTNTSSQRDIFGDTTLDMRFKPMYGEGGAKLGMAKIIGPEMHGKGSSEYRYVKLVRVKKAR
jgi:hypothetical protein